MAAGICDLDTPLGERRKVGALFVAQKQMSPKNQLERVQKQTPVRWAYFWVCLSALFTWDEGKDVEFSRDVKPESPELSHGGLWKSLNTDQRNQPKRGELHRGAQSTAWPHVLPSIIHAQTSSKKSVSSTVNIQCLLGFSSGAELFASGPPCDLPWKIPFLVLIHRWENWDFSELKCIPRSFWIWRENWG